MEKQFVPYDIALKLKELGFTEKCFTCYCNHWKDSQPYLWEVTQPDYSEHWDLSSKVPAPLWQQVFDWFKQFELYSVINYYGKGAYTYDILNSKGNDLDHNCTFFDLDTADYDVKYHCIIRLIELYKQKK